MLRAAYDEVREEAVRLAGGLTDIPRRAMVLHGIYLDSGENYPFPLVAAHGALWAFGYFEIGGAVGRLIAHRYFYDQHERAARLHLLETFAEAFRGVNRLVCIDTCTNYRFSRNYGEMSGADEFVAPSLLDALNRVHAARRAGRALDLPEKQQVFERAFEIEQEVTVAPGVKKAVDSFDCRIMKYLCLHPWVRFAYFPRGRICRFRDFSDRAERIENGMKAYHYADEAGWPQVAATLRAYRVLPESYFTAPTDYLSNLATASPGSSE
jgi:hypothetical protein